MRTMTRAARIVGAAAIVLFAVFNPWTRPVARAGSTPAVAGDFNGDGSAELATYHPATGTWTVQGMADVQFGQLGDHPVPADYNGDGVQEMAVWRAAETSASAVTLQVAGQAPVTISRNEWRPVLVLVPADYNGDGKAEVVYFQPLGDSFPIHRPVSLFCLASAAHCIPDSLKEFPLPKPDVGQASQASDIPVPADYDGDGKAEPAVFRPGAGVPPGQAGYGVDAMWLVDGMTDVQWGARSDIPVPADYDGDGVADLAVFHPAASGAWWYVRGVGNWMFGRPGDIPVPQDVNGDGKAELVFYRPSTATWHIYALDAGTVQTLQMGVPGDIPALMPAYYQIRPVAGDTDGDRKADFTIYRPSDGMWWTRFSSGDNSAWETSTWQGIPWGGPGDVPVPGDYDGDGRMDPAIYRPSDGMWWVRLSSGDNSTWETSTWRSWHLGGPAYTPLPGDYDGDGRTDPGVVRGGQLRYLSSLAGYAEYRPNGGLSATSTQYLAADYTGDGDVEFAGCWDGGQSWAFLDWEGWVGSATVSRSATWFNFVNPVCVAADFDGDRRADFGVYAPETGQWGWMLSSADYKQIGGGWYWGGMPGDVPVPGDYDGDGRADLAIYRPSDGMWWVLFSSSNYTTWQGVLWGTLPGDIPVPRR
jgi:hypothetical protein